MLSNSGFALRHIGVSRSDEQAMLDALGLASSEELISKTIPESILIDGDMDLPEALSEYELLNHLRQVGKSNKVMKSCIGQGYYGTITPPVIARNIFENPGWYTQYTPYQAEIAQGRLEALLNFQTVVSDLTGMKIANASLLDEATAAAEAMALLYNQRNKKVKDGKYINKLFVDRFTYAQTIDVLKTRALPLNIEVVIGDWSEFDPEENAYFGAIIQYPNSVGEVEDYKAFTIKMEANSIYTCVAADLLSLALLTPPGEWGADIVVGTTQRFGIPLGFGGPHAAYFACKETFKRTIPGRIIGISKDRHENRALRMALQTREQHIKREKATSNICTAQALLAIMAGMYAVFHGPEGIKEIAQLINDKATRLRQALTQSKYTVINLTTFDTVTLAVNKEAQTEIRSHAEAKGYNFYYSKGIISIAIDETLSESDLTQIASLFDVTLSSSSDSAIPSGLQRESAYLTHEVFGKYRSETMIMRYIKSLENKDLSLVHSMIPLGSCTMKLNAAAELMPLSWPEYSNIHPFAPADQVRGYQEMLNDLNQYLCEVTGFTGCSLQPNSGAQGEYTGLMVIREYHLQRGDTHRDIALIPSSAHGTNPASAVMCGMKIVVVKCDEDGNIDVADLKEKAELHKENLAALMVTYPSTHGVFESAIKEICQTVHDCGGLVYMDGANMNAQVGYTSPAAIGADVCHLNLHKTFAIPHGGGGPGMGPICVNDKLKPYLPGHVYSSEENTLAISAVSATEYSSASILLISYAYIRMLGADGLKKSTYAAILNANYIRARLEPAYPVLYKGEHGNCAHELILDLRDYKEYGVTAEDVAKRLIDYGFHAPTLSFPVAGTIMIEPTESESKEELDIFCDAMLSIKKEIEEVIAGDADKENNVLHNAPHTLAEITADEWTYPYSRAKAAFPLDYLRGTRKFWATVGRINNAYGDRNFICTCAPISDYETSEA